MKSRAIHQCQCDGHPVISVDTKKKELIMVCHYPSGASKWNPIEHRLFSFISLNWAGIPLRSLSRMTALIRGTTTQVGLVFKAAQLKGFYPTKVKVSDVEMAKLNFTRRRICPQWNYVISPTT
jgi:hypothetical protein